MEQEVKETVQEETVEETTEQPTKEPSKKEVKNKLKDEIKKLEQELKDKDSEIAKWKNEYLKQLAEVENFKRRVNEERVRDRKYASMDLVTNIITPVEYLVKACEFQTDNPDLANFLIGFKMLSKQITDVLEGDGLTEINVKEGDEFDPLIHHAVEKEKVEGTEANKVIQVLSKGYKYKDRIIKPAMVKVSE